MADHFVTLKLSKIPAKTKNVVFGFLRETHLQLVLSKNCTNDIYDIPPLIQNICLKFFYINSQMEILQDEELRTQSLKLVTSDNNEFIKFLKKILKSKLNEKIWNKCDPDDTKKIENEIFMYFWTLPVTLFKVALYQRQHRNREKPKLNQKQLRKEFTHLATWIIRRYGEIQIDGSVIFVLAKDNFAKKLVEYVKSYADTKGELYEDY